MKIFIGICIALVFVSATVLEESIRWSDQNLSWEQYKKRVGSPGIYKAFTYTGVRFEMTEANGKSVINVEAFFDPTESWVHPDHLAPTLLNHEQRHFDLTEVYARKIKLQSSPFEAIDIQEFVKNGSSEKVKRIYSELTNELFKKQQQYDVETRHGTLVEKQVEWDAWVEEQLNN